MSELSKERIARIRFRDRVAPLPDEHAAALGRMVASWTLVEEFCASIIQYMSDMENEPGRALTAELSFLQRLGIIGSLMHCTRNERLVDHWEDIASILNELRGLRNDAVHGEWEIAGKTPFITRIKARGRVNFRLEELPTSDLVALEARIVDMIDQLAWLNHELAKIGFKKALSASRTSPPLDRTQSQKAQSLAAARSAKRAKRNAQVEKAQKGGKKK